MNVILRKKDRKLIEAQSHGKKETMIDNAIRLGYSVNEIMFSEVTDEEFNDLMKIANAPAIKKNKVEMLINKRMRKIAKDQLISEGKITEDEEIIEEVIE